MVSVIFNFFPIDQQDFILINKHLIVCEMAGKIPSRKPKQSPYGGGPGRGPPNKFSNKFYVRSRYLNCERCGQRVYSGKIKSGEATLMLRHRAHSIF